MGDRRVGGRGLVAAVATMVIAAVALASCELPGSCTATWDGPVGGDYATAANWDIDTVPTATDHVCAAEGSDIAITTPVTVGLADLYGRLSVRTGASLTVATRLITDTLVVRGTLDGSGAVIAARADIRNGTIAGAGDLTVLGPATSVDGTTVAGSRRLVLNALVWTGVVRLCDNTLLSLRGNVRTSGATGVTTAGCPGTATPSLLVEPGATLDLAGPLTTSVALRNEGTLAGSATIAGDVVNAGLIDPGSSAVAGSTGRLQIDGSYTAEPGAALTIEIAGPTPVTGHDDVVIAADTDLATTALTVATVGGYVPPLPSTFAAVSVVGGHALAPGRPTSFTHPVGGPAKWSRSITGATLAVSATACPTTSDFTGLDLTEADLSGCNLGYARFGGADLTDADLTGASLYAADLTGADLTRADLTGATIDSATFTGATLDATALAGAVPVIQILPGGVRSGGIVGTPASLPAGYVLANGFLIGPGANVTGADLSGATITGADLTWAKLTGVNLTGVRSSGITFYATICPTRACFNASPAFSAGSRVSKGRLVGPGADLTGADLVGADLTDADLSRATLAGADLTNATLTNVRSGATTGVPAALPPGWAVRSGFVLGPNAYLRSANLAGVDLTGVSLVAANLISVRSGGIAGTPTALPPSWQLVGGYLVGPGARLTGASLGGLDLGTATLTGVRSGGITGTPAALPVGWHLVAGYLIGPGANLANIDVSGLDLSSADLRGVVSGGITGTPAALPPGWRLVGGYLVGPGANLAGANLAGLDLSGMNLTDVRLTTANLAGTNLAGTTLTGVRSAGFTGTPAALPAPWKVVAGGSPSRQHLVGPGANLAGVDLTSADLSGADVSGANFADAELGYVRGIGLIGTPASLPGGWSVRSGFLLGATARLNGATFGAVDLRNANLTSANLVTASFAGTDLGGANLTSANLTGATIIDADLTGTKFAGATLNDITSSGLHGTPASLPSGAGIRNGHLIARGANLAGTDLTDVDLRGLTLQDLILAGATLTRVATGYSGWGPASLPAGWYYLGGHLVGPTAKLDGESVYAIVLPGANLTGISIANGYFNDSDLSGATLINANFAGAQATSSNFQGATFTGADLTGMQLAYSDLTGSIGPGNGTGALATFGIGTRCSDGAIYGSPGVTTCAGRGPGW